VGRAACCGTARPDRGRRVGAENSVTSRDRQVLVNETAEAISSQRSDRRAGGRGSAACGRVLTERSVRAVGVVVLEVLLQHQSEVARSADEEVVEAFAAQGADPALDDGIPLSVPGPGCG
jgi:hypothetical protein